MDACMHEKAIFYAKVWNVMLCMFFYWVLQFQKAQVQIPQKGWLWGLRRFIKSWTLHENVVANSKLFVGQQYPQEDIL